MELHGESGGAFPDLFEAETVKDLWSGLLMAGRPTKYKPEDLNDLAVIRAAASSGDLQAGAWLRGEGRIVITRDFKSRFVRWDNQSERSNPAYGAWRKAVFERDGYHCRECGNKGRLNAHHIKNWADYPRLRFEVNNGLTLCEGCHVKRHPHLRGLLTWRRRKTDARLS